MIHPHRQRTEIMQRRNFHLACAHCVEDARHETDARAVTEFGEFKAKLADFAQQGAAIRMAMRIPAGRERIHGVKSESLAFEISRRNY